MQDVMKIPLLRLSKHPKFKWRAPSAANLVVIPEKENKYNRESKEERNQEREKEEQKERKNEQAKK